MNENKLISFQQLRRDQAFLEVDSAALGFAFFLVDLRSAHRLGMSAGLSVV